MKNPNSYGTVFKLAGNRRKPFAVCITAGRRADGKLIRKYIGYYASRREALSALAQYNDNPFDARARDITTIELWNKWISYRESRGKSVPPNYKNAFRHCEAVHHKRFIDITTAQIQAVIDNVADKPHTAAHVRMIFGLLYKYAQMTNLTTINKAQGVEVPRIPKSNIHKPFTPDELEKLWQDTSDFGVQLSLVYCYTGLRPSELIEIRRENVHLEDRYMIGGMKTEAGINRCIPIAEKIVPLIKGFLSRPSEFLLTTPDGTHPPNLKHLVNNYWNKSKSPIVRAHLPHDGRHTCETMLDNARIAKRTIQLIIGHAGGDIDSLYTHKTQAQLIQAINAI
jgi:integrase